MYTYFQILNANSQIAVTKKKKSAQIDTQFKLIDRNLINTCYYG